MCILEISKQIILNFDNVDSDDFEVFFHEKRDFVVEINKFSNGVDRFIYSGKMKVGFVIDSWVLFYSISVLMDNVKSDFEKLSKNDFYSCDDFYQLFSDLELYSDLNLLSEFSEKVNIMHIYYILLHDDVLKCFACDFRDCNFYFWGNRLFMLYSKVLNDIHSLSNRELSKEDRDVLLNRIFNNLNKLSELCYSIFENFKCFLDFSKSKKSLKYKELVRMIFAGKK